MIEQIALLGLGEVGAVLTEELAPTGVRLAAWDIAFDRPTSRAAVNAARLPARVASSVGDAVAGADLVISAVTAANDLAAADAAAAALTTGTWFVDLNSASPRQKQAAAAVVEAAGGRYVEAAVMSPIEPNRLASPVLLGGPHAREFAALGSELGFTGAEVYSDLVGPASATKLCRSVVVKGLEALLTESMLAARAWGVEAEVLASLSNLLPAADWTTLARYMISRSLEHGARRAEEMDEAAATVAATGLEPLMANATARRQAWAAEQSGALDSADLMSMLDAIRRGIE